MKNYFPDYKRKKGESSKLNKAQELKKSFTDNDCALIDSFVKIMQQTISTDKIKNVERDIIKFRDVLEKPFPKKLKVEEVLHFTALVNKYCTSKGTRKDLLYHLKNFLEKFYPEQPELVKCIKNKRESGRSNKITHADLLTSEEYARIIQNTSDIKLKGLFAFMFESGCRPDEVRGLKWNDIKFLDNGEAEVKLYSGKKKEFRTIIIKDCMPHLARWKQEFPYDIKTSYVFFGKTPNAQIKKEGLNKTFKRIALKAGIEKRVFLYLVRHSRLSKLYNSDVPQPSVNKYVGHEIGSTMTGVYTHLSFDDVIGQFRDKIYCAKDLTPEQKTKYDEEIDKLKQDREKTREELGEVTQSIKAIMGAIEQNPEALAFFKSLRLVKNS